jgi:xylulokinase
MPDKYIVAHDMGTSSDKAVLVTVFGDIVDTAQRFYETRHPAPGYAEADALDWWKAVCETTREVIRITGVSPNEVVGMTFSTLMQCLVPVDRSGSPLRPSMTWLDGRSAEIIGELLWTPPRIKGYNIFRLLKFLRITGGTPGHTGKDQIGKILWLKKYEPEVFAHAHKYLDAKDFVIYKLTGNMVTSVDVAVIWWLLDTRDNRNQWSPELCKLAGITVDQLAEVKESAAVVGRVTPDAAELTGLRPGTPIVNGGGDMTVAALGSGAINEGELHISLGTSGWVAGHFTKRKIDLQHYTGCVGSAYPEKYYLGMAHQETAGICLEWLKKNVLYHEEQLKTEANVPNIYELLDSLAEKVGPGAGGLIFTPWMFGERSPLDDETVRAGLFNVSLNHSREHIIRAVFEGIAFNTRWAMETLENLYAPVEELGIVGGGAKSEVWCQIMADITNRKINQAENPQQAGAKGIALLASMTLGYIPRFEDIKNFVKIRRQFVPNPANRRLYDERFREFKTIYRQNRKMYARLNRGMLRR